jgi:hypothetical protein
MKHSEAIRQAISNKSARDFPNASDSRSRSGTVFPLHRPKFPALFARGRCIFTIGSCFARNIEEALVDRDIFLPTRTFSVPTAEWPFRPNGLLNEFTPGTIAQRIRFALEGRDFPTETLIPNAGLHADLLVIGGADLSWERAIARRAEMAGVYRHLASADLVIITLGYVEAWFDHATGLFLNRMPPPQAAAAEPDRFVFRRLDIDDSMALLQPALHALADAGIRIILTVSPVPLSVTFTASDCITANEFSKSVLRVCAERLCQHPNIDYFPSYEIVRNGGLAAYLDDQLHVRDALVREITAYMISLYENAEPAFAPAG